MYSTILFLDRPRHLRYDIQAVLDLDQILKGGFMSLFIMQDDINALKLIFWAGLRHEDPQLNITGDTGIEKILETVIEDGKWTTESLVKEFSRQIVNDGWILPHGKKSETPMTIQEYILRMEELNYQFIHLTPKDFYAITPREFSLMIDNSQVISNHNIGLLCATYANCSGATKAGGGSWQVSDFVNVPRDKEKRQSPEQMKNVLNAAFMGG